MGVGVVNVVRDSESRDDGLVVYIGTLHAEQQDGTHPLLMVPYCRKSLSGRDAVATLANDLARFATEGMMPELSRSEKLSMSLSNTILLTELRTVEEIGVVLVKSPETRNNRSRKTRDSSVCRSDSKFELSSVEGKLQPIRVSSEHVSFGEGGVAMETELEHGNVNALIAHVLVLDKLG